MPTVTFRILFVFLVLSHDRRRVLHCNATDHPTADWTGRQLVEAFPWDTVPRYLIRDRDGIYGRDFTGRANALGIKQILIAPRSPWQNPYVERVIGSIRRECLDHVIVFNKGHLRRILLSYFRYYHASRTHLALGKDAPEPRKVQPPELGRIVEFLEVDEIREVLDVNLLGPVRLVQAFLPMLRESEGRIINIGSGEAFLATPANSAYCMSKYALEAFSESLRMELAPMGIHVILVEPGGTKTRIMEKVALRFQTLGESLPSTAQTLYGKSMEARRRMPERGRLQAPEKVAGVVRRALDAPKPRARYFVGADVRGAFMLGRLVPSNARDAVLRILFGFPGRRP